MLGLTFPLTLLGPRRRVQ